MLEGIGREAGPAVGQHMRDAERKRDDRLLQKGLGGDSCFIVLHRQVHVTGRAIDGDIQVALPGDAVAITEFGQVLHVDMHKTDFVFPEIAMWFAIPFCRWEAVQPFGSEDTVDGVPVEMRQEVRDDEGKVVEREAGGAAKGADDGAFLYVRLPGHLVRPCRAVLAVGGAALAPLADCLGRDAVAPG
jgi:hypothetical protein